MKHHIGYSGSSIARKLIDDPCPSNWIVCPNETQAQDIFHDLCFFQKLLGQTKTILFYPERTSDTNATLVRQDQWMHQRLATLYQTSQNNTWIVTSIQAMLQQTIPTALFFQSTLSLEVNQEYPRQVLTEKLIQLGYERTLQCESTGQFSVRGDIIDITTPHMGPLRLDFFSDSLESIKFFNCETQRALSTAVSQPCTLIPCHEVLYPENTKPIIDALKVRAEELEIPPTARREVQNALEQKQYFASISKLIPFFYSQKQALWDYRKNDTQVVLIEPFLVSQSMDSLTKTLEEASNVFCEKKIVGADPNQFFLHTEHITQTLNDMAAYAISEVAIENFLSGQILEKSSIQSFESLRSDLIHQKKKQKPFDPLHRTLQTHLDKGIQTHFIVGSEQSAAQIQKILSPLWGVIPIDSTFGENNIDIFMGHLSKGFANSETKEAWITETDLFGEKKHFQKFKPSLTQLGELNVGDFVVHIDHGIGIYQGLKKISVQNFEQDFLLIEYAKEDKLFLPIYRLNSIHPFVGGDGGKPPIDTLGSSSWKQSKQKAKKAVEEMASELITLYAKRKVAKGFTYGPADEQYFEFEREFPFEETPDQVKTLQDIEEDLRNEKPMDRLVCGDVGFGKTEIALRAAFRVASQGRQVAVLVPTTILCQQHYETFLKRFENFPITIDYISRFKSNKEAKQTLENLALGKTDIIIGTHRLLSKDVKFFNLGMLVLDEEHRFGVKHKEKIKTYRNTVDVLTLTATPIPRTLQLSMSGIRDLSLINTPPPDRKSVRTVISSFDDATIQNAVNREIQRGGQVFFLHNRVESILSMHAYLQKLLPKVRIRIGHGQMNLKTLEQTMLDFLHHKFDLLLCTTIIESGIDVPNANTLLINRADTLGLAQLYQLRGRVGRSNRDAHAHLLIPHESLISPTALKRLKTIHKFTELGSGLKIAMQDMEIRGAGNLLGSKQSGHISSVGFELYIKLLEKEIRKLKGEKVVEEIEPEIQVSIPALIPDNYIEDHQERLTMYRRLSHCPNFDDLHELKNELIDRFGPLPNLTINLLEVIELKILARQCGVKLLSIMGQKPQISFSDQASIDMNQLIQLIQKEPKKFRLSPDQKLSIEFDPDIEPYQETKKILNSLTLHGKTIS